MTSIDLTVPRTSKFIETYLSSLDCSRSLTCWLLFQSGEHKQLAELDIMPSDYNDLRTFRHSYLATKFLSKAVFLKTNLNLREAALEKFFEAEAACRQINHRGYHWTTINSGITNSLHTAIIRKIDSVLGEFDGDEWVELSNWGPGSTLSTKRDTSAENKFLSEKGTTRPLDSFMGGLYATAYPHWDLTSRVIQSGNKVITVPKNSKTDRTIAIEPGLNLWFQKGIGSMIRRRLYRFGVNLNDQSRNQNLSRLGSLSDLATVDFSSASDTIARSTVEELLPPRWYEVMNVCRSHYGTLKGKTFVYEKFSSMGNGFTFELESLIFYCIAYCVCKENNIPTKNVSVYGDDVILPIQAFDAFQKTAEFYGFKVNIQKSFSAGYFRESCGAHWWNGVSCKPLYLRELVSTPQTLIRTANAVRRLSHSAIGFAHCDITFYPSYQFLRKIGKNLPFYTSEGYGDDGFIVNFDEACPSRVKNSCEGFLTQVLGSTPVKYWSDKPSVLLARLKNLHSNAFPSKDDYAWCQDELTVSLRPDVPLKGNFVTLPRRTRVKKRRLFIPRWYNLGPWL